jgi:hypothetical protein
MLVIGVLLASWLASQSTHPPPRIGKPSLRENSLNPRFGGDFLCRCPRVQGGTIVGTFMPEQDKPKPPSLPTQDEFRLFGVNLRKFYPLPPGGGFEHLLRQIDEIEARQKGR